MEDLKCFIGMHHYSIEKELDMLNELNTVIGKIIVTRCANCGKIKVVRIQYKHYNM